MLELIFIISLFLIFYTYIGYGVLLYFLVLIKRKIRKGNSFYNEVLPDITLFITAWNEEDMVDDKMENTLKLRYPKNKLHILWVTDGSSDLTNEKLSSYPKVAVQYRPERMGKTAAMNRGIQYVKTPIVIFTDANTMLNEDALMEIVGSFSDPNVGCVAGEKRILQKEKDKAVSSGEGIYWKYESKLKAWDSELNSVVGAAGELFAIRTELYEPMPVDTLLDDFILSLRIARNGFKTAYNSNAYAIETSSANMAEEEKRKVRIAAGGLQSIWRLRSLLNIFRYGMLSFQYVSHRVLRWSVTPLLLFLMLPVNLLLAVKTGAETYRILLILQFLFYLSGMWGYYLSTRQIKNKLLFVPYYFLFMNINVIKGVFYLKNKKNSGVWDKAKRSL